MIRSLILTIGRCDGPSAKTRLGSGMLVGHPIFCLQVCYGEARFLLLQALVYKLNYALLNHYQRKGKDKFKREKKRNEK